MGLIRLAAWLLFLFFSPHSLVWAQNLPAAQNYVSDFAQVIDSQSESDLNQKLSALESQTGVQVAVVTVAGLEDMSVEEYAEKLFQKWGIGKKGEDNGLLLLVSPSDREVRFEVGYGLEPVITDGRAGEIIRNQLIPQFKQNNYQQGIIDAVGQISKFVSTPVTPSTPPSLPSLADFVGFLITGGVVSFYLFSFFIPIIVYFTSFLARTKSYYLGGVIGFILGLIFLRLVGGLIFGLFGLILDYVLSRNYKVFKSTGRRTDFFGSRGGFWSGGGGFKGGGGGFGGFGGGRSGGGGASGKW